MQTQQQRLAAYLEHARSGYSDEQVEALVSSAVVVDRRLGQMDEEQRQTYGDLQDMLSSAISEKFPADDGDDCWWGYLVDFSDEWAVFSQKGQKLQVPYTLDGDTVTIGEATPVREVTTYVPTETKSANPATPKRAFSSLIERPPAHVVEAQIRMDEESDPHAAHFLGYASTTGTAYAVRDWLGEYDETIRAGAFAKTLGERPDVPMLRNHDPNYVLANTSSGTSQLAEDGMGLRNGADFDRRQTYVNDMCISLQRRDIDKMSFSFQSIKDDWNDAYDQRGVSELRLYDTSIVTYPANPATSAELVDAMRSALGREGRSLWLADSEMSVRSALPIIVERQDLPDDADDLLERAVRALAHADEVMCRHQGMHGRARTFHVASAILELRAGKKLSAANEKLLQNALAALSSADKHHAKLAASHATATDAVSGVLHSASGDAASGGKASGAGKPSGDGKNQGTPPGSGDPINPSDGAGPRAASLKLRRQRELELRELRR